MLKFIKHSLENIVGIEIFPLISLIIFFTFFVLLGLYVIKADKKYVNRMSELPLDLDNDQTRREI